LPDSGRIEIAGSDRTLPGMNKSDFLKLIGAESAVSDYLPVAALLRSGYGCAGYFNREINSDLSDTIVLVNARLAEFRDATASRGTTAMIEDFNEFIEEIVQRSYQNPDATLGGGDEYGKSIPLVAIPLSEMAVVYPVARIEQLLRRVQGEATPASTGSAPASKLPSFFDFDNKSLVLKALRTKLW